MGYAEGLTHRTVPLSPIHRTKALPPGLQRYNPPSGREVDSPPGEAGGRVTKDRISLPQSFATQNPAPSSEGGQYYGANPEEASCRGVLQSAANLESQ